MRKKSSVVIVLVAILTFLSFSVFLSYYMLSPRYVLLKASDSIKRDGISGLYPFLSADMKERVNDYEEIIPSSFFHIAIEKGANSGIMKMIIRKASKKIDWNIEDIMVGFKSTNILMRYNYENIEGEIYIKLKFENMSWKIDSIDAPVFENIHSILSKR